MNDINSKVYISEHAGPQLLCWLRETGLETVLINGRNMAPPSPVYEQILTHPDIHMCQMGLWENAAVFTGSTQNLGSTYPEDIIYNAVCTGRFFIHNLKYTSPELMKAAAAAFPGITKVDVRQGYTRCSCLPVDDTSFITYDRGICKALESKGADVLLIEPGHIALPGFSCGFIGGCAGGVDVCGRKTLVFNGNLNAHPDAEKITAFIRSRDIDVKFFSSYPLEDIGSILTGCKYCENTGCR